MRYAGKRGGAQLEDTNHGTSIVVVEVKLRDKPRCCEEPTEQRVVVAGLRTRSGQLPADTNCGVDSPKTHPAESHRECDESEERGPSQTEERCHGTNFV